MIPEPISFLSISAGLLTFVRTAILTLRSERQHWKGAENYLAEAARRLDHIFDDLDEWRTKWILPDPSNEEGVDYSVIFEYLWGKDWIKIKTYLDRIEQERKGFEPFLDKLKTKGLWSKGAAKINLAFGGREKVDNWLTNIKTNLDNLNLDSTNRFIKERAGNDSELRSDLKNGFTSDYVLERVTEFVLTELAKDTSHNSNKLFDACFEDKLNFKMKLMVDLFPTALSGKQDDPDKTRREAMFTALALLRNPPRENAHGLPLEFSFLIQTTHDTLFMRTLVRGLSKGVQNAKHTLSDAFEEVWKGKKSGSTFVTSKDRVWFRVTKDTRYAEDTTADNSTSVAELLDMSKYQIDSLLDRLRAKRAKLALLLAEFGLLFLKTGWMLGVCRCRLRKMTLGEAEEYMIRPGFGDRIANEADGVNSSPCWCRTVAKPPWRAHLPYLGLLIAEMVVCRPIIVHMSGDEPPTLHIDGEVQSIEDLTTRVRHRGGYNDYADAVKYCLESTVTAKDVEDSHFESYYEKVYWP
jgi:hypothetical protein